MKNNYLFYKKLFALVFPIAVQNLMTALVSASDALMLGFLNQTSLSSVSLATQVQFVLNLFYAALTIGTTILAAQYFGKKDIEAVEKILAIGLKASILISVVFFFAAFFFPYFLMNIFTNESILIKTGIPYLRIVSFSYLFTGISQIYLCIMKNCGKTLKSTLYSSVSLILNIILNAILIFGLFGFPKLEIIGAAIATVISKVIELFFIIIENMKKDSIHIKLKFLLSNTDYLKKDFYHYTMPVLANELVWGFGFTMFSVIMGHLGNNAIAANSIANILKNIITCVCLGVAGGSSIIIGNELGRGNLKRAKEYGSKLCKISLITGTLSGILLIIISPVILKFSQNITNEAYIYLKNMLYICSYYIIGKSINSTVVAGIFCAGGDTKFGLLCDTITMWFIIIPIGMLSAFVFKFSVLTVYFILNLDEIIKLHAVYKHYKKYNWIKNLTIQETTI